MVGRRRSYRRRTYRRQAPRKNYKRRTNRYGGNRRRTRKSITRGNRLFVQRFPVPNMLGDTSIVKFRDFESGNMLIDGTYATGYQNVLYQIAGNYYAQTNVNPPAAHMQHYFLNYRSVRWINTYVIVRFMLNNFFSGPSNPASPSSPIEVGLTRLTDNTAAFNPTTNITQQPYTKYRLINPPPGSRNYTVLKMGGKLKKTAGTGVFTTSARDVIPISSNLLQGRPNVWYNFQIFFRLPYWDTNMSGRLTYEITQYSTLQFMEPINRST